MPEMTAAISLDIYPRKTMDQLFDKMRRMNPQRCRVQKSSRGDNSYLLLTEPLKFISCPSELPTNSGPL
jgi:hypothetical protein